MGPDGEAPAKGSGEDDGGGAVAELVVGGLAAEEEVDDLAEVPLRDLHRKVGGEAAEAWLVGQAAPERSPGRGIAFGYGGGERLVCGVTPFQFLAGFDDGAGAD